MTSRPTILASMAFGACLLSLASGCRQAGDERYIPSEELGQRALSIALEAWQNGKVPPGLAAAGSPNVQIVDTRHKPGQKLTAFTVLGPTAGDAGLCIAARLTFDNPPEKVRARYVVLGIDPLWVWRYEDYEMLMHWDCPMETNQ